MRIWSQSRYGRAIDMVNPVASEVDFHEMCMTLAFINRFTGCGVSVAFHTLMVHDLIEPEYKVHALLHDMHEGHGIGDIATPAAEALAHCAASVVGPLGYDAVRLGLERLKLRHDTAIYAAAGLEMPNQDARAAIKCADLCAMMTERRDFLAPPWELWTDECESIHPAARVYESRDFGDRPERVGTELYNRLLPYLPCGERELRVA